VSKFEHDRTWNVEPGTWNYALARLRFAGRAGFRAVTRFDATAGFDRAAIDRRAPLTSDGDSSR
jgi:hypothetical protein